MVSRSLILTTCYVSWEETGPDRIRMDTSGLLTKRLIGYCDKSKPPPPQLFPESVLAGNSPQMLPGGLPALILLVTSGSNFLSPVRPHSLLRLWASPFVATLVCQHGLHPLFLTSYSNLPTLMFEETEGVRLPYRVANNRLAEPSMLRSSLVIL